MTNLQTGDYIVIAALIVFMGYVVYFVRRERGK